MNEKNILVLGAFGGVANAFLRLLSEKYKLKNKFVLLDKKYSAELNLEKNYNGLNCECIRQEILLPEKENEYSDILKKFEISFVIDLTDMDSIPVLEATNRAGISYLNTAMNDELKNTDDLVSYIYQNQKNITNAAHIIGAGMNPGNVNVWVRNGIEKFGIPNEIVHFEFDDSMSMNGWKPIITWSPLEFLTESVYNPGGVALGLNRIQKMLPNALKNLVDMEEFLSPVLKLETYPRGLPIVHEENVVLANKYNIPSKFIYAIHPETISHMERVYAEKGTVGLEDLVYGGNVNIPLSGKDFIGVILKYPDKDVYYYNFVENKSISGTNATCHQVGVGVLAAFLVQLGGLPRGIHFTNDLYDTDIFKYISENLVTEEKVFYK